MTDAAAVILCGGQSRRMGAPKAWLPFGDETLLQRTVRVVSSVVPRVVVAAAPGQLLPRLPDQVTVVADRVPNQGPLEGICCGLEACAARGAQRVFVCSTDLPFLSAGFVRRMLDLLVDADVAVPHVDGYDHPVTAAYSVAVLPVAEALLRSGERRPRALFERVRVRRIGRQEILAWGLDCHVLQNVNTPRDYAEAVARFLAGA